MDKAEDIQFHLWNTTYIFTAEKIQLMIFSRLWNTAFFKYALYLINIFLYFITLYIINMEIEFLKHETKLQEELLTQWTIHRKTLTTIFLSCQEDFLVFLSWTSTKPLAQVQLVSLEAATLQSNSLLLSHHTPLRSCFDKLPTIKCIGNDWMAWQWIDERKKWIQYTPHHNHFDGQWIINNETAKPTC